MRVDSVIIEQIISVANLLGLPEYVIEKDYYLTHVIGVLSTIEDDNFQLIFQGGTCLAKAHNIVDRMSEDCDFRMAYRDDVEKLSKQKQRNLLRQFRKNIIAQLEEHGFQVDKNDIRVRNEGQFMSLPIRYQTLFEETEALKPYLALEFFLNTTKLPAVETTVTTLIQKTLGTQVNHPTYTINAMAVNETAAEKWVALTRRVATSTQRVHYRDKNLVRHLYDLHRIEANEMFDNSFAKLALQIIEQDKNQFKNHNNAYFENPKSEIERSLIELQHNEQWQLHWQDFVETMVFAEDKPSYADVLTNVIKKSENVLATVH